jgi:hypothetical protein
MCSLQSLEVRLSITKSPQSCYWDLKASLVPLVIWYINSPSRELVNLHEQGLEEFVCAKRVLFSPTTTLIWMSSASGRLVVNAECTLMLSKEFRGIVPSVRDCSFDSFKEFRRFPQVGRVSAAHRYEISRLRWLWVPGAYDLNSASCKNSKSFSYFMPLVLCWKYRLIVCASWHLTV